MGERYNGAGNNDDEGSKIIVDNNGNSHVTGYISDAGDTKMFTIKYNNQGSERWSKIYSASHGYDYGNSIKLDNAGNVYVGGTTYLTSTNTDCILIKYSSTGTELFTKTYDGPAAKFDGANEIFVHPSGAAMYVAGYSDGIGTAGDGVIIKYSQLTGNEIISNEIPAKFSLSQTYPNPFNPSTKIEFALPESGNVKLEVFDITGKIVSELVNGSYSAGYHSVSFNAASISAGVYYYRIRFNGLSEVRKMMLVK